MDGLTTITGEGERQLSYEYVGELQEIWLPLRACSEKLLDFLIDRGNLGKLQLIHIHTKNRYIETIYIHDDLLEALPEWSFEKKRARSEYFKEHEIGVSRGYTLNED